MLRHPQHLYRVAHCSPNLHGPPPEVWPQAQNLPSSNGQRALLRSRDHLCLQTLRSPIVHFEAFREAALL
jgi:hypothetical protein